MSDDSNYSYHSEPKWFLTLNGKVQGPFEPQGLLGTLLTLTEGEVGEAFVWKRGLAEWLHARKWQNNPDAYAQVNEKSSFSETETVVTRTASFEKTQINPIDHVNLSELSKVASNDPQMEEVSEVFDKTMTSLGQQNFRVQVNFVDQPVMSKDELLKLISQQQDVSVVSIQDPVSREWKDVYNFPEIIEKLGLSRRAHPRVPILAQFNGKSTHSENFTARIITVSEGGMGFTEVFDLKIGDQVEGLISSPHFFIEIHVAGEVIYSGLDGYVGIKFVQINEEARSSIIDYVNKFKSKSL